MSEYELRCTVALRVVNFLRQAIENNRNVYHGGLVPNITSVSDVLTMDFPMLLDQIAKTPALNPAYPIECDARGQLYVNLKGKAA